MNDLIDSLMSNTLYMMITASILGILVFFGMKKMVKLFLVAFIFLIAFLSYVYYTDSTVEDTVEEAGEVVR